MSTEYGADQIQILEGLEAVRKRPGMYLSLIHISRFFRNRRKQIRKTTELRNICKAVHLRRR